MTDTSATAAAAMCERLTRVIKVEMTLSGALAGRLLSAASARSIEPVDLLANIVEAVLDGDLVTAVLDD